MFEGFIGVLIGIIYAAFGYAVAKAKNNEAFDGSKFFKTVLVGFIVGSVGQYLGVPADEVARWSVEGLATILVDKFVSLFYPSRKGG